jgi:hypothetical protein
MLAVVYCGIPKVEAESLMVVQLWKWFIGWADGFGIVVSSTEMSLICGFV